MSGATAVGKIPPGPWYVTGWAMLKDAERAALLNMTRKGRACPITAESPVTVLGNPSKMPGYAWGMMAGLSCPGAVTTPGENGAPAICAACYALKGAYGWACVKRAYSVRLAYARASAANRGLRDGFVRTLSAAILRNVRASDPYLRIHDAGDFFSPSYIDLWTEIATMRAEVRFWAPTRSWWIAEAKGGRWAESFARLNALDNVTIRPSALHIGDAAPVLDGWHAGSTVVLDGATCQAYTRGGLCGPCRACWDSDDAESYPLH